MGILVDFVVVTCYPSPRAVLWFSPPIETDSFPFCVFHNWAIKEVIHQLPLSVPFVNFNDPRYFRYSLLSWEEGMGYPVLCSVGIMENNSKRESGKPNP
jgi:hypothetical protein